MSADLLRTAARLMRERASDATPGPWSAQTENPTEGAHVLGVTYDYDWDMTISDAEHIASWHPVVAVAVADWLERAVKDWPTVAMRGWCCEECLLDPEYDNHARRALAVAHAYLGSSRE